jgi:hypothetical protein
MSILQIIDCLVNEVVGVGLGHDLSHNTDTIATQVTAKTCVLGRVFNVGELDRGDEVCAQAFDVLDLGAQSTNYALPTGLELGFVTLDQVALDACEP